MAKGRVKPKRGRPILGQEYDGEPHENLAVAIVNQAVKDAQDLAKGRLQMPLVAGSTSKWELINFFRSKWCGTLLGCTNVSGEEIIERMHLYELPDT
jgi:hypothetical protein